MGLEDERRSLGRSLGTPLTDDSHMLKDQIIGAAQHRRKPKRWDDPATPSRHRLLIETVTCCVADILTAPSVTAVLPAVLSTVAKVVRIDRVVMLELQQRGAGPPLQSIFFKWESDVAAAQQQQLRPEAEGLEQRQDPALREWQFPLTQGKPIVTVRRTAAAPVREYLTRIGVVTILIVPVTVEGRHWGQIGFDDCRSEHDWTADDIKILTMLAEVIGAAITRERYLGQARQRQGLLQAINGSAAALMRGSDLHQAITRSLGAVAAAISADRMVVIETATPGSGAARHLLRNSWQAPGVVPNIVDIAEAAVSPAHSDVAQWMAPLEQGMAVQAQYSSATPGVTELLARLEVRSALLVPIMVDGRTWGHIGIDLCQREREWSGAEVDVLKTLAELIGTAISGKRRLEALAKANTIVQNSSTILYRLRGEPELPMIYISQNIASLGYDAAEFVNTPTRYQQIIPQEDLQALRVSIMGLVHENAAPALLEFRLLTQAGAERWFENHCTPVRDGEGRVIEIEGILTDITERKAAEQRIALLARTDALTGVANRRTFAERLFQAVAAARRGAHGFAVLYLDLDRFKEINDTQGHQAGDRMLQQIGQRLRSNTRAADVVARLGGDEFAIVQGEVMEPTAAGQFAQKLIDVISAPYTIDAQELHIGVSVGIALYNSDVGQPEELLAQADQALYHAKHAGRGQYRFYSNEIDRETRAHLALAEELRAALGRDELEIRYQPQVELASDRIAGMEAQLRWNHPTRGLLLPEDFLPIAEQFALMPQLGRWMLDTACRQMSLWRRRQLPVPVVTINIALAQIKMGREFVRGVMDSIQRWGIKPSDIELDVTELALARTTLTHSDAFEELQRLGVGIAIDDFGARYSSLDYLRTYRVSRLKIARGMIAAADVEPGGSAMVRAILGLAKELGVAVVADGVETESQRKLLVAANVRTQGQGFYYSPDVSADESITMLRAGVVRPQDRRGWQFKT